MLYPDRVAIHPSGGMPLMEVLSQGGDRALGNGSFIS